MYFYKDNIPEGKEKAAQIIYYTNNDIVVSNFRYVQKARKAELAEGSKPPRAPNDDRYPNIQDEKHKFRHHLAGGKDVVIL